MRRTLLSLLLAAVLLAQAATAAAQNPIDDYRRNGTIDPCKYSDGQLRRGSGNLPPDVEQYAPGLADALNQGREGCGGGAPGGTDTRQNEAVPAPSTPGGGGGSGWRRRARAGPASRRRPPPWPAQRSRLANISTPGGHLQARPGRARAGCCALLLVALAIAAVVAAIRLTGADTSRLTRPLGAAFRDAGERSGDADGRPVGPRAPRALGRSSRARSTVSATSRETTIAT